MFYIHFCHNIVQNEISLINQPKGVDYFLVIENVKNKGEMHIIKELQTNFSNDWQSDSNLYFRVCNTSKMTSITDQSAVKNGIALEIAARNRS